MGQRRGAVACDLGVLVEAVDGVGAVGGSDRLFVEVVLTGPPFSVPREGE